MNAFSTSPSSIFPSQLMSNSGDSYPQLPSLIVTLSFLLLRSGIDGSQFYYNYLNHTNYSMLPTQLKTSLEEMTMTPSCRDPNKKHNKETKN